MDPDGDLSRSSGVNGFPQEPVPFSKAIPMKSLNSNPSLQNQLDPNVQANGKPTNFKVPENGSGSKLEKILESSIGSGVGSGIGKLLINKLTKEIKPGEGKIIREINKVGNIFNKFLKKGDIEVNEAALKSESNLKPDFKINQPSDPSNKPNIIQNDPQKNLAKIDPQKNNSLKDQLSAVYNMDQNFTSDSKKSSLVENKIPTIPMKKLDSNQKANVESPIKFNPIPGSTPPIKKSELEIKSEPKTVSNQSPKKSVALKEQTQKKKLEDLPKFIKQIIHQVDTSKLPKAEIKEIMSKIQDFDDPELLSILNSKLFCKIDGKIKKKIQLGCSHTECKHCVKAKVLNYIQNPSPSSYKVLCCPKCKINYSDLAISSASKKATLVSEYNQTICKQTCTRCGIEYNINKGFLTELKCLHLCINCYTGDLIYNQTSCSTCFRSYKSVTGLRTAQCDHCKKIGSYVKLCFKKICEDHLLCYYCLGSSIENKACLVCPPGKNPQRNKFARCLKKILNKNCCICQKTCELGDLDRGKTCCKFFVCLSCKQDSVCVACHRVYESS